MDELKETKLKNYQYLNEVVIKGEMLFIVLLSHGAFSPL